jgi:transcriptional regulator with XRE-family HTH domain
MWATLVRDAARSIPVVVCVLMARLNHRLNQSSTASWLKVAGIQPKITAMKNQTGKIIKDRLEALEKTQGWLAEKAGVSINAVSKWTKDGKIGRKNVPVVAEALGLTTDQLLIGAVVLDEVPTGDETLERLNSEERHLIELYRGATQDGRTMILGTAGLAPKVPVLSTRRRPN